MPTAYDVFGSGVLLVFVALLVLVAVALIVIIRVALAGRRTLAATAALGEARLELARERTARLRAGLPDAPGAGGGDPAA
ncbi:MULTISPECIES: hypothetical protein [Clavibacter]|uniref:Uncharacterized protein n=1 Tax=Clavibacter tessellarius TaxID=31965 RepID=A0A154V339_9MICO|nr:MULTISPECIES: hypothetical protein [Clavibacter]KZC95795.1 hypothetical protein AWH51_06100 [Clavibacter michiganensis subsp. tessellarius]MDA3804912.1 hypothetical protein [Clavibacter sp. CT19]